MYNMRGSESIKIRGSEILTELELHSIRQAIILAFPQPEEIYTIERFIGNLSSSAKVYKLIVGSSEYVVRILEGEDKVKKTSTEIQIMRDLSNSQVSPPLVYANEQSGIMIMKFIQETPLVTGSTHDTHLSLVKLARKIKLLHSLPLRPKPANLLASNLQKDRLQKIYQMANSNEAYQIYYQGIEYLNQLSVFIKQDKFCHNNLHYKNILHSDGEIYIIDWETSGTGDSFLDLANFIVSSRLTSEQEKTLLLSYLEREPTIVEMARFKIMKHISYLRYSLGLFATVNLNELNLNELDFDKIVLFSDSSIRRSIRSAQDTFIFSFSLLKESLSTIRSQELFEAIRHTRIKETFESYSTSRLFTLSNPLMIDRALAAVSNHAKINSDTIKVELLSGGSEQANSYKINVNNSPIALRVYRKDIAHEKFQRESSLYRLAASINISPSVVFIDETQYCLATTFLEKSIIIKDWQRNLTTENLRKLAYKIRRLHEQKIVDTSDLTITGLRTTYLVTAQKLAMEENYSSLKDIISIYQRLTTLLKPEVLSHNSLSRDNILFDGENFQFIDWENATMNDRLYDPAFLSCYFFLNPEQESILLNAYLGRQLTHIENQKFYLVKLLVLAHLTIVTIAKCRDFDFIAKLPKIESDKRYFNYRGKARHLLDLQTDFAKYLIYQLLTNEIRFEMKTGKFLACEKSLFIKPKEIHILDFLNLPLSFQRSVYSKCTTKELFKSAIVNKKWATLSYSFSNDIFPIPDGFSNAIPEADRTRVLSALTATFTPYKSRGKKETDTILSPTTIAAITPFSAGMSPWSNTCKLIINDESYVIRLMSTDSDATSMRLEIFTMQLFSALGVSPKIHYASAQLGIIIMDYVNAIPSWYHAITPEVLTQLGLLFNQMNQVLPKSSGRNTFFTNRRLVNIYDRVYRLCRVECATDFRFDLFRKMLTQLDLLKPLCESLTEHTICHHDFNVWNVLQHKSDKSFSAIDFEFSQSGDRLFDLGSLVVFMRLDKKTEAELLESFFGQKPSTYQTNKYFLFKQYAWLHYIVMGLGICKKFDFTVSIPELDELPPFNDFSHTMKFIKPIDPHTDIGHYKLAIMFIKQALIDCQGDDYLKSMEFFSQHIKKQPQSSQHSVLEKK